MKKNISKVKSHFKSEISQAKANSYEAILLPFEVDSDPYCLNNIDDEEYIFDIATDYGWDQFLVIDLLTNESRLIDLYELEAA